MWGGEISCKGQALVSGREGDGRGFGVGHSSRSREHQENGDSQRFRGNALGWKASLFMGGETRASRSP